MSASTAGSSFIPKPTNPLHMGEIRELIGHYLTFGDWVRCLRISRAWYASFLPFVWRDVDGNRWLGPIRNLYSTLLLSHISWRVQSISFDYYVDGRLDDLRLPNLREVRFHRTIRAEMAGFFENHPTVTRAKMRMIRTVNWKVLAALSNLKMVDIGMNHPRQSWDQDEHFWSLCTRLEVLISPFCNMLYVPVDLQCLHLKEIHVTNGFHWTEHELEFLRRCPNLEVLKLVGHKWTSECNNIVQEFTRLAGSGTWSKLHSLQWNARDVSDERVAGILESMPWCDEWIDRGSSFDLRSFQALGRHFQTLTVLTFENCNNVTSEMVQETMSSCPMLKILKARLLKAQHIAQGKTWICTSLTSLQVFIDFEDVTETARMISGGIINTTTTTTAAPTLEAAITGEITAKSLQRRVFEQLSLLSKLETLSFGGCHKQLLRCVFHIRHIPSRSLDLRLCSGLGLLETLTNLKVLGFLCTVQRMETEDVLWMNEHWPKLREVIADFSCESSAMATAVKESIRSDVKVI
ncbi:hypothetical protein B0O80DRAFT_498305 [Mortierella sp. GBAus27b]|nr:hypothetical protein B0O80DRAFT_498305 [Mortierella sp. GBAus27b]